MNHTTNPQTAEQLASLAVNAANALRDEKRHYEIACQENARLRAVVARIGQMADAWEQRLPEVIRTPAVVSAIRAALEPAVSPSAVVSADRATLRDRIAAALYEHMHPGSYWSDTSMPSDWRPTYLEEADAVLAVLPEQTDRATLLRAAEALHGEAARLLDGIDDLAVFVAKARQQDARTWRAAADLLRRLAADQPAETQDGGRRETVEYFVQSQQPDGTWESASGPTHDLAFAAQRLAARHRMMPDLVLRLAERTTTVNVRALPGCLACRHWSCDGNGPCGALLDAWQRCACTGPAVGEQPAETQAQREPDPDCERCDGSGLDPDAYFVDRERQIWTHAPCSECLPEDDTPEPVERVKHSGPDTKFCVLCLSGEHERVDDAEQPAVTEQPDTQTREARVVRCSAVMLRVHHAPHGWEPQPGMDPVHCPGYPQPGKES